MISGRKKSIGIRNTKPVSRIVGPNSRSAVAAGRVISAAEIVRSENTAEKETVERKRVSEPAQSPSPASPAEQSGE